MPNILPKIDNRDQQDLVSNLRRLILRYCPEWERADDIESDKQVDALVHIFSNMLGHVVERLNKAPEKNFITFLNLVGISPTPPRVAKVPLVFKPREDSLNNGYIPLGSKVSAKPENQEEIIYETEKNLTVIKPKLVRAVSIDPRDDSWSNQDFLFSPEPTGKDARIFGGDLPVSHRLYIGNLRLLNFSEAADMHIDLRFIARNSSLPDVSWHFLGEDSCIRDLKGNKRSYYCLMNDGNTKEIHFANTLNPEDPLKFGDPDKRGEPCWYYIGQSGKPLSVNIGTAIKSGSTYWYYKDKKDGLVLLLDLSSRGGMSWCSFDEKGDPVRVVPGQDNDNVLIGMKVFFPKVTGITANTVSGYDKNRIFRSWNSNWIFSQLNTSLTDANSMPDIEYIKVGLDVSSDSLLPDAALYNYSTLDIGKDFFVFGERPAFNDTFYIASRDAFSKKDAEITLNVELSNANPYPYQDTGYTRLLWEYWNGVKWELLFQTSKGGKAEKVSGGDGKYISSLNGENINESSDDTAAFTRSGEITFRCPDIKPFSIGGEENYWIRARIIEGDYGKDGYLYNKSVPNSTESTDGAESKAASLTVVEYVKPSYSPPSVKKITIGYSLQELPDMVITENNFSFTDRTWECLTDKQYFKPFLPCTDREPAFYIAFDQDISTLPISLFFPLSGKQIGENPIVAWEYWNGKRWVALSVYDTIRNFTFREIIQFIAPSDVKSIPLFGTDYYWIRARMEEGAFLVYPHIGALYQNAVWARNYSTIEGEIVGSSNGEPEQTFQLAHVPVLEDQTLWVRETLGNGEWINWQEVKTFSLSASDSRHYMLDHNNGTILFGDGKNGMVPPAGLENIKCDYRFGGGARGNVKSGLVTHMWDSFSEIDSVTNPVAGDGGFEQEDAEQAKIRGPYTLKSRDRGVTCEDIEWMVREAMPHIAKVKCFPTMDRDLRFSPGNATVIIVPDSEDPRPYPSQELLGEIYTHLSGKTSASVAGGSEQRINVIGPDYIRVGVEANVTYKSSESVKIIEGRIIDNLRLFFDPIRGGDENKGWEFGRNLYVSEVYSVIKNTPGVDYITDLAIKSSVQCLTLVLDKLNDGFYTPRIAYPKYSTIKSSDNRIEFSLAAALPAKTEVKRLMVKGFKENDLVRLRYGGNASRKLIVVSVSGDVLECQTVDEEPTDDYCYPAGSDIEAVLNEDLTIRSYILNEVPGKQVSFFVKIAVPESRDTVLLCRADEYTNPTPLRISEVRAEDVFLDEDELVYSGTHFINSKPGSKFPYLVDQESKVIHDLGNTTPECCLMQIDKDSRLYVGKASDANGAVMCKYCFPADV